MEPVQNVQPTGSSKGGFMGINFKQEFSDAFEIIKFNKAKMKEVAGRKSATKMGVIFIVVPLILNCIFFGLSFGGTYYLYQSIISVIMNVAIIFLMSFVAVKAFNGKGKHEEFFRVISYANLLNWVSVIFSLLLLANVWSLISLMSLVSIVISIWALVVGYHVLIDLHQVTSQNAVLTIVIGIIGGIVLSALLMALTPKTYLYNSNAEQTIKEFENWSQYMR